MPNERRVVLRGLFQARMWREYAQDWDRPGLARDWVAGILKVPRAECLRRARAALTALENVSGK